MERQNIERLETTAERAWLGLAAPVLLGIGVGLLLATKSGAAFRGELRADRRRLRPSFATMRRNVRTRARAVAKESAALATRIRTATREGVREAKKHLGPAREPSRESLAGVEGLAEFS